MLLLISVFAVACANNGVGDDTTAPQGTTSAEYSGSDTDSTGYDTTEPDIYADLPTGSYSGFQFDILTSPVSWTAYENMCVEVESGEPVEDEIYYRNI